MKTKDLLTVVTTALGTAALTVAILGGGSSEAGRDADGPGAKIPVPKFSEHGVEMTLTPKDVRLLKAGQQPVFEITAINTTNQAVTVSADITMSALAPGDRLSRVPAMPTMLWQQSESFTLRAGARKVMTVSSPNRIPANSSVSVWLSETQPAAPPAAAPNAAVQPALKRSRYFPQGISAFNFSTRTNDTKPASLALTR